MVRATSTLRGLSARALSGLAGSHGGVLRRSGLDTAAGAARRCAEGPGVSGAAAAAPAGSTRGVVYYQGPNVPTSVRTTGAVFTNRDAAGSDERFVGTDPVRTEVEVWNGRGLGMSLDENGFTMVNHAWKHVDYYDNSAVLSKYYTECEALIRHITGAREAVAFDHNLRAKQRKLAGDYLTGGNAVQEPLVSYGVHNDYTLASAPARIELLAQPFKQNDTLRVRGGSSAIDPARVDDLLRGRYAFFNVWRNVAAQPVQRLPLGLLDAATTSPSDLVVFEIRYADRVGENYFSQGSPAHKWYYFPELTRDEVVILKCWDSRGRDFLDPKVELAALDGSGPAPVTVPATFSLHTGFEDLATLEDAPDRESIEVRLVAFFD